MKQTITDVVSASLTYYGEADLGRATTDRAWSIKRTSVSGGVTTVDWPMGLTHDPSAKEAFVWADRAAYTYGLVPDTTPPTVTVATMASNNADTARAKVGDIVTLTITGSEAINTFTVTIGGRSATVTKVSATQCTAAITMTSEDTEGALAFSIVAMDEAGNSSTARTTVTSGSAVTFDKTLPTLASGSRTDDTTIEVTLSELALTASITKANAGGFTVNDTAVPATTYAVSAIATGSDNTKVVLTVATIAGSQATGVTVKYAAGGNGTVADRAGNLLATNATGVAVAPW